MISGYALHGAGIIDRKLNLRTELTAEEAPEWGLGDVASEASAMGPLLKTNPRFLLRLLPACKNAPGVGKGLPIRRAV
jgi:hypothetical protein